MNGWACTDALVYRCAVRASAVMYASALWLVGALGLVTLPPATAALHEACRRDWGQGDVPRWRTFVADARRLAGPSYRLMALQVGAFALLAADVFVMQTMMLDFAAGAVLALSAVVLILLSQTWVALPASGGAAAAVAASLRRCIAHPVRSTGCAMIWLVPWGVLAVVPRDLAIITVLALPALTALASLRCSKPRLEVNGQSTDEVLTPVSRPSTVEQNRS